MIVENTQPYTGVTQSLLAPTERLTPVVPQQRLTTVGIGLITCGCALLAELFIAPYLWSLLMASPFYRTLQIYSAWRGWIALTIMCVCFAAYSVWYSNRQMRSINTVRFMLRINGYCIREDIQL